MANWTRSCAVKGGLGIFVTRKIAALLTFIVLFAWKGSYPIPMWASEPGFQQLLDRYDIPLDIPAERKFILVNVPAFEVLAISEWHPCSSEPDHCGHAMEQDTSTYGFCQRGQIPPKLAAHAINGRKRRIQGLRPAA